MEFKRKRVDNPQEFLKDALLAESYVQSFLKESDDGLFSDEVSGYSQHNFYVGTAGILRMYSILNQVSNTYLDTIESMSQYLSIHCLDGIGGDNEFVPGMSIGFYSGIAGIGLVLNEVYRLYGLDSAKEGALRIVEYYQSNEWTDNLTVFFDGGILLFLIDSYYTYDLDILDFIQSKAEYMASCAIVLDSGIEFDHLHVDFKHKEPNFEFGSAGMGYVFCELYKLFKEDRYLDIAIGVTKYLKSISVAQEKGYLIPYKLGVYDDLFYLGNCHGPVGSAKLFFELYQITNDSSYLNEVFQLVDGAFSLGAPFKQSPGFWNTVCVCCGPAGYIPLFIGLYRVTGDEKWKKLAHKTGEILCAEKSDKYWKIAFDRTKPDVLSAPAGYFTGAAGIAVSLLNVYVLETNKSVLPNLIDGPYLRE